MRCEEVLNQLNARADDELRAEDADALGAHLAECSQCRAAGEAFSTIDADLRRAFVPRRQAAARLAENSVAAIRAGATELAAVKPYAPPSRDLAWPQLLIGLSAGFLLAVAL